MPTLVVVVLWLWPTGLHAQSDELVAAYRQSNALSEDASQNLHSLPPSLPRRARLADNLLRGMSLA